MEHLQVSDIDISKVYSVYSGKNGRCCCGCSGKHTYAAKFAQEAGEHRGYDILPEEVSDRTIKTIVNKMLKTGNVIQDWPDHVYAVSGERLYIAYFD